MHPGEDPGVGSNGHGHRDLSVPRNCGAVAGCTTPIVSLTRLELETPTLECDRK